MNLLEAIQNSGDDWYRPIEWRGSGEAYYTAVGNTFITTKNTRACEMNSRIDFILSEWEIVSPQQVISERK